MARPLPAGCARAGLRALPPPPPRAQRAALRAPHAPPAPLHRGAPLPRPPRARSVLVEDEDDYEPTIDISLANVAVVRRRRCRRSHAANPDMRHANRAPRAPQGRRIGSGSFGEVFAGELAQEGGDSLEVVLKKRRLSLNAQRVRVAR